MRLLIATTVIDTIEAFLLPYARHYRARGWRVDAVCRDDLRHLVEGDYLDAAFRVPWSRNPLDPTNLVRAPGRLREIVAGGDYDLLHVHTPVASFVTRYALRNLPRSRRPAIIYTAHGFHFHPRGSRLRNGVFLGLEKLAGRWTDYLVVMNRHDEAASRRHELVPPERLKYMPGIGVDLQQFRCEAVDATAIDAFRADVGMPSGAPYFLMAAEFIPRKRHTDLLRAYALLSARARASVPDLVLAGKGVLEPELRELVRTLGLSDRVRFAGFRRDVATAMRGAAALVLTSDQEGLPRCILEAMAMGTPVIATRIRGCVDLLDEGCGILVEVGDVAGLAAALGSIVAAPEAALEMSRRAKAQAARFDLQSIIRLHDELYQEALRCSARVAA